MRLTLLIPELLWSEPGDADAWAGAAGSQPARFLAARRPAVGPAAAWETTLAEQAGAPADTSLAALRAAGEAVPPFAGDAAHCLCADPVHLRFHQDRLILADAAELALGTEELAAIATTLDAELAPYRFHFPNGGRGYVRLAAPVAEAQCPLSQRIGCEVKPADLGRDGELRRLANEIQMLLHAHPVNAAREAAHRPRVNALWIWGAESVAGATAAPPRRFVRHGGEAPLFDGLARRSGDAPTRLDGPLPRPEAPTLVFCGALLRPAQYQDATAWAAAWRAVERELLGPAFAHLAAGRVAVLDIVAPTAFGVLRWSFTPWPIRLARLRPAPRTALSALAAELAADFLPNPP